jgi:hypothetical protein
MRSIMSKFAWILTGFLLFTGIAEAKKPVGTQLKVLVTDELGEPVALAVVRNSEEADRHHVNSVTGEWETRVLYMETGEEIILEAGMSIELEVSAPGYVSQKVTYLLRKRKNVVEIALQKLDVKEGDDTTEDVNVNFGRDRPLDK